MSSACLPKGGRPIVPSPERFPIGAAGWWLVVALVSGIIEILSPTFGFVFVSVAAVCAAGAAAVGLPFSLQLIGFSAVALLTLVFLRPRFVRRLDAQGVPTRVQSLIGQLGTITSAVDPASHAGRVDVAGQDWAARCVTALPTGTRVRVTGADGIVLGVEPLETGDPKTSS